MIDYRAVMLILGVTLVILSFVTSQSFLESDVNDNAQKTDVAVINKPKAKKVSVLVSAKVTKIVDGDTIHVIIDGKKHTIRFGSGVDAFESCMYGKAQKGGLEAKEYLSKLIKVGDIVQLKFEGSGNHGRDAAIVYYKNKNINREMIKSGWAMVDLKYSRKNKEEERILLQLQEDAKANKRGIWAKTSNPLTPWDFRKQIRDSHRG